jgi:hypothetical protein
MVIIGDIIFFFDPENEPEKLENVKKKIKELVPNSSVDFMAHFESEYPTKAENLIIFFETAGFQIEWVEELFPIVGIICAKSV